MHSLGILLRSYFSAGLNTPFFYTIGRQLLSYVLVVLSFILLRIQSHQFLSLKGEAAKMDREILFYPNHLSGGGDRDILYDQFDPLEVTETEDGKEDPNRHR
jgi:hypothetical protein